MHKGKKHTESSYQPIKDKSGKVILTSEQARNVDEDHHEFDHKPSQSEIDKAAFINSKMKKMRQESQSRKEGKLKRTIIRKEGKLEKSPLNHCESDMMHQGGWAKMRTLNSPGTTGNKQGIEHNKKMRGFKLPHQSPLAFKGANSSNSECWSNKVKVGTKPSPTRPGVTVNDCVDPSSPRAKNK